MLWIAVKDGTPAKVFPTKRAALDWLEVPKEERKNFPVGEGLTGDYIIKTDEWSLF